MAAIRIKRQIVGAGQVGIDISGDEVKIGGTVYESAWLIEKVGVHLCYSRDAGSCLTWVTFSDSAAWRFDDKASAERVIDERRLTGVVAVEHEWGPR